MPKVLVHENIPKPHNVGPQLIWMRFPKVVRQAAAGFPNYLEVMKNPHSDQFVFIEGRPATLRILFNLPDGFECVRKAQPVVPHRGKASRRTVSRTRSRSPRAETTSTLTVSNCSSLRCSLARSRRLRPGSRSTRRSTSLRESFSPLATEPKTRTLAAPQSVASRRISSRLVVRSSSSVMVGCLSSLDVPSIQRPFPNDLQAQSEQSEDV
jgi:hypothetical protein